MWHQGGWGGRGVSRRGLLRAAMAGLAGAAALAAGGEAHAAGAPISTWSS